MLQNICKQPINKKLESNSSGFLLYSFYVYNTNLDNDQIALDAFRNVQSEVINYHKVNYWTSKADLVLALEILDKNELIEADLNSVLFHFDINLMSFLRKRKCDNMLDLPYYTQVIFNRLRHNNQIKIDKYKILLSQIAEKIISEIDKNLSLSLQLNNYITCLIKIYNYGLYKAPILRVLKEIENKMCERLNFDILSFTKYELLNFCTYPLICKLLRKKTRIDIGSLMLNNFSSIKHSYNDEHFYYLINSGIKWANKFPNKELLSVLDSNIKIESKLTENIELDESYYLSNLTIHSLNNPKDNSWDEILLIPNY